MKFTIRKGTTVVADDMSVISLGELTPIQGGSHIVPLLAKNQSITIQLPKCRVKNGVVRTSKKQYCDLEFDLKEHVLVTDWLGSFEEHCIDMLSERCGDWFGSGTSETDIEDLMISNVKVNRDGKTFTIRTDIGSGPGLKIQYADQCIAYDITGNPVPLETIDAGTTVVPLILLKCIRLAGSFSIDIQMTQAVVIEEQKCQIDMSDSVAVGNYTLNTGGVEIKDTPVDEKVEVAEETPVDEKVEVAEETPVDEKVEVAEETPVDENTRNTESVSMNEVVDPVEENDQENENIELGAMVTGISDKDIDPIHIGDSNQSDPIRVVDLNIDDITETAPIELMESKEVRLKLYKDAKRRAIAARKHAIEEIMRARNIKMEFMLDDEVDSESDVDSDFESVYGDEEMV